VVTITITEIATHVRRKPETVTADLNSANVLIRRNWKDEPCILEAEAAHYVKGGYVRQLEAQEAQRKHNEAVSRWTERRRTAVVDAQKTAFDKAKRRKGVSDPEAHHKARTAGWNAGASFERLHARPSKHGPAKSVALAYVDESEEGSLAAAVLGKLIPEKSAPPQGDVS
jgi:hypothetical protein